MGSLSRMDEEMEIQEKQTEVTNQRGGKVAVVHHTEKEKLVQYIQLPSFLTVTYANKLSVDNLRLISPPNAKFSLR